MRSWILILPLFLLVFSGICQQPSNHEQHQSYLNDPYWSVMSIADELTTNDKNDLYLKFWNLVETSLGDQAQFSEEKVVKKLHWLFHKDLFRQYRAYSTLHQTIENGYYDCVSAAMLYSYIFKQMGFEHEVIETNFHVFVKVTTPDTEILIEPTDPNNGVIVGKKAVRHWMNQYQLKYQKADEKFKNPTTFIFGPVSFKKLCGLQLYNQAVKFYNQKAYLDAKRFLGIAQKIYQCPRLTEMSQLIEYNLAAQIASNQVSKK